jgi:hypothetical protein
MAGKLIEHYHMQKVPQEGCWFSLSYSSDDRLEGDSLPGRYAGRAHPAGSAIVAVETSRDFSAMHRLQSDEVWHFYAGSPIDMLLLYPDGHGQKITLGPNVLAGQLRQFTVPRGVWQGSAPRTHAPAAYSFFADQLSPGFDNADFEIGYRDALQRQYPAFARDIEHLTRTEFAVSKASLPPQPDGPTRADTTAPAKAFSESDIPVQIASPGVSLKELVGEKSPLAPTSRLSVAQFTLAPGRGSTVFIPAMQPHSIEADSNDSLVFLAISAPAFTPQDYFLVQP